MDFVDATLLRLADPAQRTALFDQAALAQLVRAAGGRPGSDAQGPYAVAFEQVRLVFDDDATSSASGTFAQDGTGARTVAEVRFAGLPSVNPRIDALCTFTVVATARLGGERVDQVEVAWPDVTGIDGEIGALPTDPAALETARRERFKLRVRAHLSQPAAFDDAALDRFLAQLGARSVSALLEGPPASQHGVTLRIRFEAPGAVISTRRTFAVSAALLVRTAPLSLASLLADTRRARTALDRMGIAASGDYAVRTAPLVIWALPPAVFDEAEWPAGGTTGTPAEKRERRRAWASDWLVREGIGLVVPPA